MLNIKFALLALVFSSQVFAATVSDDFTQATDPNDWVAMYYACLTAGTTTNNPASPNTIPGCNYSPADTAGSGALRLTPASTSQHGAIVSDYTFPSNQGLQVTFTTYSYGGNSAGPASDGADGMSFFLMDGSVPTSLGGSTNLGSWGGSLGYSCSNSNSPYTGLTGAYLGLGMDEYGNFLNSGDNTATGIPIQTSSSSPNGYNSFTSGSYQQANRIGLRGAGNVSAYWLNANYPDLYPSTTNTAAVDNTCTTGLIQNGSGGTQTYSTTAMSISSGVLTITVSSTLNLRVGDTINMVTSSSSKQLTATNGVAIANSTATPISYVVTSVNLSTKQFTVATAGTGTVSNPSYGRFTIKVMDYPAIPGGYWVLPNNQKIANEAASTRANATPITYKLLITPSGLLTYMYSYNGGAYQSVLTNFPITTGNGPLPSTFRFGFAGSTGGATNVHEITCFLAQPSESASSAGANTVQAGQVRTGTQVYLASYNLNSWAGSLVSKPLVNTAGTLTVSSVADWDGNCQLTGGPCSTMASGGVTPSIPVEAPASRRLLTWNGTTGVPLQTTNLTSAQQTVLNSTDSNGANRLDWLRGGRSNEQTATPAGPLRARGGVLGDIVNSSPTWIGSPSKGYPASFTDSLYGSTGAESSYSTYSNAMATRLNVVYVGSNDGLLHGFRAGSNNADGSYNSANNDGYEVIGFMPSTVLTNVTTSPNVVPNVVGLTNPTYGHNYFVDAAPGSGDLYYNGKWHTWLVGGLGEGGAEIYALDVTDPTGAVTATSAFSEGNAASLVMGDWTSSTLTCTNASGCGANMGKSYGIPLVRRLHNGQWAIIFGNGINSTNQHAGVFVGLVSATGTVTFYWLDTGTGSATTPDGISYVSSADLDGDHVTDYLYAGDLLGNVWRFDLTSSNPADWGVSSFGQPSAAPLFTAKNSSGIAQPITTKIAVTSTNTGGSQRILLGFGTGRATPFTATSAVTYVTGTQTVYGIWDWDTNAWNNGATTASSVAIPASFVKYAALPETTTSPYRTFTRTSLLANAVASQTATTRTVAITTVCWQGSTNCASGNNQYGWRFDLPDAGEQIVYSPIFSGGELFVNTTIPPTNTLVQCTPSLPTGWTMGFNMASGGGNLQNIFPDSTGSLTVASGGASIAGLKQGGVGSPWVVSVGSQQNLVTQTAGANTAVVNKINPQGGVTVKRISWEVLR